MRRTTSRKRGSERRLFQNGSTLRETMKGPITAGFGQRLDPFSGEGAFHWGVDISSPYGSRVHSSADGILFRAGPDSGYGNEIPIDHGFGMTTKYGHLSRIFVVVGQETKRGQVIGAVGMTGKATCPHLHYEVMVNTTPVNPVKYLHEQVAAIPHDGAHAGEAGVSFWAFSPRKTVKITAAAERRSAIHGFDAHVQSIALRQPA